MRKVQRMFNITLAHTQKRVELQYHREETLLRPSCGADGRTEFHGAPSCQQTAASHQAHSEGGARASQTCRWVQLDPARDCRNDGYKLASCPGWLQASFAIRLAPRPTPPVLAAGGLVQASVALAKNRDCNAHAVCLQALTSFQWLVCRTQRIPPPHQRKRCKWRSQRSCRFTQPCSGATSMPAWLRCMPALQQVPM